MSAFRAHQMIISVQFAAFVALPIRFHNSKFHCGYHRKVTEKGSECCLRQKGIGNEWGPLWLSMALARTMGRTPMLQDVEQPSKRGSNVGD